MAQLPGSPLPVLKGRFTEADATRLLWRAGFGPRRGEAARVAALGLDGAVASLTRPSGPVKLIGRPPHGAHGRPLDPVDVWGDDHCWWLDRMVRSNRPLQERMTLVWHSWFATSIDGATQKLMLRQNVMMRRHWLGNFLDLFLDVTRDPAMLLWLNGVENNKWSPNENYGREMMELFSLGQGRGYGQRDVEEQARALTGFTNEWSNAQGPHDFRFELDMHDGGTKQILGTRGRFDWRDSCRLCVGHWSHPSFMVSKLWSYFVAEPIPGDVARALERHYVESHFETRPLIEAILRHPLFYAGERMVLPPVVFCAGMLRALGHTVQTDTARWAGRLTAVNYALGDDVLDPSKDRSYPAHESPSQALGAALAHWGGPSLGRASEHHLLALSRRVAHSIHATWEQVPDRVSRQNALRALIPMTPDWQTC
jgi:uncharacterized protein (DUF1800 family)